MSEELDKNKQALQDAFLQFNRLSQELEGSYKSFQDQVYQLNEELEFARRKNDSETRSRLQLRSKYASLLNILPAGVIVLNAKGEITEANVFATELLGTSLLGKRWQNIIDSCFSPQRDDGHEVSLLNGKRVKLETRALDFEPGQIILITDQTATRELQQQLSQNERLSALGKMSSALAHQIRTPLSAALLHAGNLRDMPLSREQAQRIADKLSKNLQQLEGQVRDMLVFSRANIPLDDQLSVAEFADAIVESMIDAFEAAQVELLLDFCIGNVFLEHDTWQQAASSYLLRCNKATLLGAVVNLLNNALQASLLGESVHCEFRLNDDAQQSRLTVLVSDSGCGIHPEVLARINQGENFATTKNTGTGLGLTVVRAVSAAHSAHFVIDSKLGEWTRAGIAGLKVEYRSVAEAAVSSGNVVRPLASEKVLETEID